MSNGRDLHRRQAWQKISQALTPYTLEEDALKAWLQMAGQLVAEGQNLEQVAAAITRLQAEQRYWSYEVRLQIRALAEALAQKNP
ncbi:hypothetical protein [Eisenibacter elegans]|jgi:hypothetical protein|uniref:hypothetical protein n=1 Tax=Eisenibacter elegans TaxID=997 RepID=UPI000415D63D|nr:hypothetical protein [Eisenibacter elegans]